MPIMTGVAALFGIVALLVTSAGTAAGQTLDRAAVPLYTPPLTAPVEAAATGIAPEVTVRVLIDAAGRVADVEITRIEPSTELDAVFEKATRDGLRRWRYAPALEQDDPVEARLEWTVKFAEIGEREKETQETRWTFHGEAAGETLSYRRYILSLPLEIRTRLLEEHAQRARTHLTSGKITKYVSQRFIVYTDAPDKEVAQTIAHNLEATFNVLSGLLRPWIRSYPEPYRVVVFVYYSRSSFEALKREVRSVDWSVGFYNPLGIIALHMEMPSADSLQSVLLHEATHAYMDRYVSRPGVLLPRWLDEGLAEYLAGSRIKKGKLTPGKTRRTEIYQGPWGILMGQSANQLTLEEIRRALKKEGALNLKEMLEADRQLFYGEKRRLHYGLAWLFIHFLRHGEPGWAEDQFAQLVLFVAEGYPPLEALGLTHGEPADLEARFRGYVMKF